MNVTVLTTGGTIASTAGDRGAEPTKGGRDLLEAVPELETHAEIAVEEVARVPSYEMDAETLETIGDRVRALEEEPSVDAVVLTHGTDTMEETAYVLDATVQPDVPVVLTGAQRRPDEVGADGPSNLLTAVHACEAFHDADASAGGTYVAFDEEIHAARAVTKVHASKLDAFRSVGCGPVASVDRDGVVVHRRPRSETVRIPVDPSNSPLEPTVYTVKSGSCVDGELVEAALERGADGIVVEGTGLGNATAGIGAAVERAIDEGVPVVAASRCLEGRTTAVYGGEGGGRTLLERGATFAGDLPAQKARLKLALALSAYEDRSTIREVFEDRSTVHEAFEGEE
ncbi:asparaginase [Natrialbaceae archaeon GCM10025810]|uniref:asparaginase n=1 Tax=Halovalidus salilacus TaxID=3075124 RepID=UPI003611FD40